MPKFTEQFMTNGKFDYKKLNEHRNEMLESLNEEPDNEQFTQEVKTAQDKSQGKGKKADVAKPSVQAVKNEGLEIEVYDADAINGVTVETIEEGKKWIAGAIKKPGALHKALGVPAGETIPVGKLEKAAEAPGKLGKRARLAKTLKTLRQEHAGQIDEATHPLSQTIAAAKKLGYNVSDRKTTTGHSTTFHHPVTKHRVHASTRNGNVNFMDHNSGISGNDDAGDFHHSFKRYAKQAKEDHAYYAREHVEQIDEAVNHKKFMATYKRNEDNNHHMENVLHLAKHYGTEDDVKAAQSHINDAKKAGHNIRYKENYDLHKQLWDRMHAVEKAKQRNMKEDAEQIEESDLTPKQKKIAKIAGDPHKIDQHDLAALRGGHKMKEDVEQIEEEQLDELKKSTLVNYVYAALADVGKNSGYPAEHPATKKLLRRLDKRKAGVVTATRKIGEDVEQIDERELTPAETKKKEEVVKSMKKKLPGFKERYGERAKEVMYATATKIAKKD